MQRKKLRLGLAFAIALLCPIVILKAADESSIGREVAIARHLQDGEEFSTPLNRLIRYGQKLFTANFTIQEGAGRPFTKGTGAPIADNSSPLIFPRNFNRLSGPDSNSCSGCHNEPFVGGGGDRATTVFVLGQRFDSVTFDHDDSLLTRGAVDERGNFVTQNEHSVATSKDFADERKTIGMFGAGFIEMLARQMTGDLQSIRNATAAGQSNRLISKGVYFGILKHNFDGTWDMSHVEGLPAPSLSSSSTIPPSLLILPFHQAGAVVSLRVFSNNAFNQHRGMQPEERFGTGVDADGDGVSNELTTADITAVTL